MSDPGDLQTPDDPELGALYRRTRIEQPPAELDAAILGQARHQATRRKQRLLLPLASAALVLLGLSLTLQVLDLDEPLEKILEESAGPAAWMKDTDEAKSEVEAMDTPDKEIQPTAPPVVPPGTKPMEAAKHRAARSVPAQQEEAPAAAPPAVNREIMEHRSHAIPAATDTMELMSPSFRRMDTAPRIPTDVDGRLQFIRELLRQGRLQEAREALHALLQSRPGLDIPEDLRMLKEQP